MGLLAVQSTWGQEENYSLNSGTVTFTHTADSANSGSPTTSSTIQYSSLPTSSPSGYSGPSGFTNTFGSVATSATTAQAAVYQVTNNSNLGVSLTAGSGVVQQNVPGHLYSGASVLDTNVNLAWFLLSAPFPSSGFPGVNYQFPIGGVVGVGGTDTFVVSLNFYDDSSDDFEHEDPTLIGSLNITKTFTNSSNAPASFSTLVSGNDAFINGTSLPQYDEFLIEGDIKFRAKNDESPSSFDLTADSTVGVGTYSSNPTGDPNFTENDTTDVSLLAAAPLPAPLTAGLVLMSLVLVGGYARRKSAV
jgi:hypothetical protein